VVPQPSGKEPQGQSHTREKVVDGKPGCTPPGVTEHEFRVRSPPTKPHDTEHLFIRYGDPPVGQVTIPDDLVGNGLIDPESTPTTLPFVLDGFVDRPQIDLTHGFEQ
jgi:hypothetical protein